MKKKLNLENILDTVIKAKTLTQVNENHSEELGDAVLKYKDFDSTSHFALKYETERINDLMRDINYILNDMLSSIEEAINEASQSEAQKMEIKKPIYTDKATDEE